MSFSGEVKKELVSQTGSARNVRIAQLTGIMIACGRVQRREGDTLLLFQTENPSVAKVVQNLLKKIFDLNPGICVRKPLKKGEARMYLLLVSDRYTQGGVAKIMATVKMTDILENGCDFAPGTDILPDGRVITADSRIVASEECRKAYIRGAFLAGGSISDPEKSYHFEVVYNHPEQANQLREIINCFGMESKVIARNRYSVVYVKDSEQIADLLKLMGAFLKVLELENMRVIKDVRNNINRQVNCETANLTKTVCAASEQIDAIEFIRSKKGLGWLPDNLEEMARVRLENPDVSLQELGGKLSEPVGKSGVNHRLRKIRQIADELGYESI